MRPKPKPPPLTRSGVFAYPGVTMSKHADRWCAICRRHLIVGPGATLICPDCDLIRWAEDDDQ